MRKVLWGPLVMTPAASLWMAALQHGGSSKAHCDSAAPNLVPPFPDAELRMVQAVFRCSLRSMSEVPLRLQISRLGG